MGSWLPVQVREEMARCFDLVRRLGRGAVYLGSSRVPPTHPHFLQTTELARETSSTTISNLLALTTCCKFQQRVLGLTNIVP
jgi:hypothetical protein